MERVTIREAAQRLGVSPDTIRRRIAKGELQAVQEARPQGFVWMVELPRPKAQRRRPATRKPPRPKGPSPAELEAAHLRQTLEMLTTELESRRREVAELHQLLAQSQLLLSAGKVEDDEPRTTVEVRETRPQEPPPVPSSVLAPRPPARRRLTLRERVLGYVRR
jgi:hypothetical protein